MLRQRDRSHASGGLAGMSLLRDPVLAIMAATVVVLAVWYMTDVGGRHLQLMMLWPLQVLMDVVFGLLARRAAMLPGQSPPARRFWNVVAFAGLCITLGDGSQVVIMLRHQTLSNVDGGPLQMGFMVAGIGAVVVSMLLYPNPTGTRGERVRFWLDSMTVLVSGAVLAWCFAAAPGNGNMVATVLAVCVVLVAAFGAVKMLLSGAAPMRHAAAAPMIISMLMAGAATFVHPSLPSGAIVPGALVLRVLPSALQALGPRIHVIQARADPETLAPRRRRPYSLLPYAAFATTFAIMLVTLPDNLGLQLWGVVGGVLLTAALVVARQLLTFHDNFGLISRLDATLLDLRSHEEMLVDQASHDGLTRLANRTTFIERVTQALVRDEDRARVALLLIDLDDFKAVNDTLGHAVGDALLVTVAERLRAAVRPDDVVARLGGDEFAILLRDASDQAAAALADRLLTELARPVGIDTHALIARASIGIAPGRTGKDVHELMRNADIAMYAAKDAGKSNHLQYEPEMGARILEAARLGDRLRDAIGTDQFRLVYQPIVNLADGATVGAEALLRWHQPGHGPTPPTEFIGIAESTGLIVPLGRWILREACQQAAAWRLAYPAAAQDSVMSVNVAGRQLQEPGFVEDVIAVLAETGLPADRLVIEVTETSVLKGGATMQNLHALRQLGVGLALDDFGTAASSLGLLLTCPVSSLKLDRSFVDGVTTSARQSAVATAVIQIARALDLTAVAEGIETEAQADYLGHLGYQLAQGFLFSRPLPAEDFAHIWAPEAAPHDRLAVASTPG